MSDTRVADCRAVGERRRRPPNHEGGEERDAGPREENDAHDLISSTLDGRSARLELLIVGSPKAGAGERPQAVRSPACADAGLQPHAHLGPKPDPVDHGAPDAIWRRHEIMLPPDPILTHSPW